MPYASHQSVRIYYQVDGEGPALVLHHGLGGSLEVWRQLGYAAALRDTYKVIMLDARGHGASDKPHDRAAYGLPKCVGDVLAVLEALQLSKAHFLGYSMGGRIGLGLAKYAPERVKSLALGGTHLTPTRAMLMCSDHWMVVTPRPSWRLSRGYWKRPFRLR